MRHLPLVHKKSVHWPMFVLGGLLLLAATTPFVPASAQNSGLDACLAFDRAACNAVLVAEPDNLTALFMRGLAAELEADDAAALKDFDATAAIEPRHFGAQLWRHIAAASRNDSREAALTAYLAGAQQLPPWPRVLAELYLGKANAPAVLKLAQSQPQTARAEAICAAEYHLGRYASLTGNSGAAMGHFRNALATGAKHVFEYQAAARVVDWVR